MYLDNLYEKINFKRVQFSAGAITEDDIQSSIVNTK